MKGIKFFLILITIALLLISCKKEKNDEIVTYHFTSDDSIKLLPHYVNGKIFTFVNSEGDERKFEIINIEQKYSQLSQLGGGIFSPSRYYYYFYYEEKIISLKDYKNEKIYCINIWRYPIDVESAKVDIYKKFANRLNMELTSHQDGNYSGSGYYQMSFYYGTPVITLLSNGLTFNKVHILDRELNNYGL